jgi:hypothetical protein
MRFGRAKTSAALISFLTHPRSATWYLEVGAAIAYAKFYSRSNDAVIHVYDETGKLIEVQRHSGDFKEP